jgi:hypothetical protein
MASKGLKKVVYAHLQPRSLTPRFMARIGILSAKKVAFAPRFMARIGILSAKKVAFAVRSLENTSGCSGPAPLLCH